MAAFWFKQLHYELLLQSLDKGSGSTTSKHFSIPEAGVDGELFFIYPQSDFCAIQWHYTAGREFELGFDDHDNFMSLHYFIQKGKLIVIPVQTRTTIKIDSGNNQAALSILFEKEWLLNQFSNAKALTMMAELAASKKAIYFGLTAAEKNAAQSVVNFLLQSQWNNIVLRASLFTLLDQFRNHLLSFQSFRSGRKIDTPMEKLELVLMDSIRSGLPAMKDLAKEFAMSESTLKRQFKQAHGMSMGKWFLSRKMELGAEWLKESEKNVSVIAHDLGYEKVSAFIEKFRELYHSTPGEWRRQFKQGK